MIYIDFNMSDIEKRKLIFYSIVQHFLKPKIECTHLDFNLDNKLSILCINNKYIQEELNNILTVLGENNISIVYQLKGKKGNRQYASIILELPLEAQLDSILALFKIQRILYDPTIPILF